LAFDLEPSGDYWRSGVRLASTDADRVITLSDDWISILGHHAQIAVLQLEMNSLARTGFEMNAPKSAESDLRSAFHIRKFEIELDNFISRYLSRIGHRGLRVDRSSCIHSLRCHPEIAVAKGCVAEPIAERVERLAVEVPVGPVGHPVIFDVGNWLTPV